MHVFKLSSEHGVGTSVLYDGQTYTIISIDPHIRSDGKQTTLISWHSECATCGAGFVSRTPVAVRNLNRRCSVHKSFGRAATKAAKERKRTYSPRPVADVIA